MNIIILRDDELIAFRIDQDLIDVVRIGIVNNVRELSVDQLRHFDLKIQVGVEQMVFGSFCLIDTVRRRRFAEQRYIRYVSLGSSIVRDARTFDFHPIFLCAGNARVLVVANFEFSTFQRIAEVIALNIISVVFLELHLSPHEFILCGDNDSVLRYSYRIESVCSGYFGAV